VCIGTASITRSTTATAEAKFWRAIQAFAIRAMPLDHPGNVALAPIKTRVPGQF
jgi:hypothetical protein